MAVCVAVVGKDNSPKYISCLNPELELQFQYKVHTSLDVVEEKLSSIGKTSSDVRELYLGLLYSTEEHKVFGYVTNTKMKFIIVVESSNTLLRDNEVRMVSLCILVGAFCVALSAAVPYPRTLQLIPLVDQQVEESAFVPRTVIPANDLQTAATGHGLTEKQKEKRRYQQRPQLLYSHSPKPSKPLPHSGQKLLRKYEKLELWI
jgi:hypothetical protein